MQLIKFNGMHKPFSNNQTEFLKIVGKVKDTELHLDIVMLERI